MNNQDKQQISLKKGKMNPKRKLQGHEFMLHGIKQAGSVAHIELLDSTAIKGVISDFDKYTVTIKRESNEKLVCLFKHGILSIEEVA